ncbi:urease accessory protein UreD [Lichenihabitans sp. PAMC28606]|uniref:urease accessory protein UreD n=1 Tax=Lichenihabitans sp. PAMC28606 TaxID=2880932 RepID=UPI001D0BCACC|nr:urease accessory protein UreD [Lichenihabitans sp. PAMC28606]UDL93846.1 urease accessory protein UreD [Lichenihabitans sp. PAMC28606]
MQAVGIVPDFVRAAGGVRMVLAARGGRTVALERAESGGYRARFPTQYGETCEAVLINTGGGMAGGDSMRTEVRLLPGASAVVTTQAAEKIYRSQGPDTSVEVALHLEAGSRLAWLPQEMILFADSRWRRDLSADIAADASLTLIESVMFGRTAMREVVDRGLCRDRWRIRRAGRLVFADEIRLDAPVAQLLSPASGGGAHALATVLHVAPDAEDRLDQARALLEETRSEAGASAWNGMLLIRFVARDAQVLRSDLVRFVEAFRGSPMPRSW